MSTNSVAQVTEIDTTKAPELYRALITVLIALENCLDGDQVSTRYLENAIKTGRDAIELAAGGPTDREGERW